MEDNTSQDIKQYDHLSNSTPVANSVMIVPRAVDDELNNVSLNEHDDYMSNNLSHIELLHSTVTTDPNLYRHNRTSVNDNQLSTSFDQYPQEQFLQYLTDTSNDRLKLSKSKSIATPSLLHSTVGARYDPNNDISFLYDLVTPPTTTTISQTLQTQLNNDNNHFFDDNWNE